MNKNYKNIFQSIAVFSMLLLAILIFTNSSNFYKAENNALKVELVKANTEILNLEMQFLDGNKDTKTIALDSTTFKRDFITVEEADIFKDNYKDYINTHGNSSGNKKYFDINTKLNTALSRSRDLAGGQTGCRVYYGLKNPEDNFLKHDFIQIIYPIDEYGAVLEFGPKVAFVPIVTLPRQEFINARKLLNCPPYCD